MTQQEFIEQARIEANYLKVKKPMGVQAKALVFEFIARADAEISELDKFYYIKFTCPDAEAAAQECFDYVLNNLPTS